MATEWPRLEAALRETKRRLEATGASWCPHCGGIEHSEEPDCRRAMRGAS